MKITTWQRERLFNNSLGVKSNAINYQFWSPTTAMKTRAEKSIFFLFLYKRDISDD